MTDVSPNRWGEPPHPRGGEEVSAKGLRNLIMGLEERALSCDNKVAALMAVEMLRIAWKGLNG